MPRRLTWIDPDGASWPLEYGLADVFAAPGVQVAGMPPIRARVSTVPLQPGGRWQQVDHGPREVAVPIVLTSEQSVAGVLAELAYALDPIRGDGRLRLGDVGGDTFELFCRYVDALQVSEPTNADDTWRAALVFRAVDPYWYDTFDSSFSATPGEAPAFFPIFPLRLGASEAQVAGSVDNSGHVATWPVWTIVGPADAVTATNVTTGETFTLDTTIAEGETVVIDTRPGVKTVVSDTAGSLFAELTAESSLWRLVVGTNAVEVTMVGSTGDSSVEMRWRRRWLTIPAGPVEGPM